MMRPPSSGARRPTPSNAGNQTKQQADKKTTVPRPASGLRRPPSATQASASVTSAKTTSRPGSARQSTIPTAQSQRISSQSGTAKNNPSGALSARTAIAQTTGSRTQGTTTGNKTSVSHRSGIPTQNRTGVKKPTGVGKEIIEESKGQGGGTNSGCLKTLDGGDLADNPWGATDPSQYYIELGGVSKFLQFRETLKQGPQGSGVPSQPTLDPITGETSELEMYHDDPLRAIQEPNDQLMIRQIEQVLSLLDQVSVKSMQYQRAHALKNYSDLLLAESTNYRSTRAQQLASFLAQINGHQRILLTEVRKASRMSENCLVLSKTYHADLISIFQSMAVDLAQQVEQAPVGFEKSQDSLQQLGELGQAGMRQALNYRRLKEQLEALQQTVAKLQEKNC